MAGSFKNDEIYPCASDSGFQSMQLRIKNEKMTHSAKLRVLQEVERPCQPEDQAEASLHRCRFELVERRNAKATV